MTTAPHTTGYRIDRDDLLARLNLTDVLDALTPGEGSRHRRAWRCPEPGHPDEHPSVKVSTDRTGTERWRCWSGGHGGTAIDAVIAARGMTVGDAMRWLNDHYAHLQPLHRTPAPTSPPAGKPTPEVIEYVKRCEKLLWTGSGTRIHEWLNARGLSDDVLAANHVGADPGRRYLPRPNGLPAGWPAAVYPALDPNGTVAYFQARFIDPPAGRDKYDNPARRWAANPRLAWTRPVGASRHRSPLIVTEGIPDALVGADAGFSTVGVLGSMYPDRGVADHIAAAVDRNDHLDRVVICFDADESGSAGAKRLAELLNERIPTAAAEIVNPPAGMDLTDWSATGPEWTSMMMSAESPVSEPARPRPRPPTPSIELGLSLGR